MWVRYLVEMSDGTTPEAITNHVEKITEHKNHLTLILKNGSRIKVTKENIKSIGWKNYQEG